MKIINHETYVSLEVAKLLKQAGFDWKCSHQFIDGKIIEMLFSYSNSQMCTEHFAAPTLAVAQKWLREMKGWEAQVAYGFDEDGHKTYVTECGNPEGDLEDYKVYFPTYEETLEAGIKKALEIILEKGE